VAAAVTSLPAPSVTVGGVGLRRRWPSRAQPKNARWAGSSPGGRRNLAAAV